MQETERDKERQTKRKSLNLNKKARGGNDLYDVEVVQNTTSPIFLIQSQFSNDFDILRPYDNHTWKYSDLFYEICIYIHIHIYMYACICIQVYVNICTVYLSTYIYM